MKLIEDFKKYEMSAWERIVLKFNLISLSTMIFLEIWCIS